MTQFVITTQALENYGAHAESGKFRDGKAYWKFKSGTDYLVSGLDRPQDAMAFVAAIGMENGIGWKEFPAEVMSLEEYLAECYDDEHREFKMKYIKRVSPEEVL
jgi:hypothetical protein